MIRSSAPEVRKEKRKSLFLQELTPIFRELLSDPRLAKGDLDLLSKLYINRVDLSADGGMIYVFFATFEEPGQQIFDEAFKVLKYFKKTMRHAFAQQVPSRYTPDLLFFYDTAKEKERRIEELFDKVAQQNKE